jgi:hypothetical protein
MTITCISVLLMVGSAAAAKSLRESYFKTGLELF